ncbi:MAG: isoprenylcysteine carboxylmethyltransferase family protein [Chloroflexota bacterium]|nr:isoprenylcysteine carboxylmethyltransferase family protein [Chloroflexota bacterium]
MKPAWRQLVAAHRQLERTRWGAILLGNVWPAYLFALPLGARAWALAQQVRQVREPSLHEQARLLQEAVTILFLALVVVLFAVRRRAVHGQRATWRDGAVALAGTFLLNLAAYLPIRETASTTSVIGSALLVVLGTAFTIWSLATLGRCFGLLPEVRGLVVRGPYEVVRHPVYLGELIASLGILMARPDALIAAILVAFGLLQYWRALLEERVLSAAYPREYEAYRKRVPRLLPGLR